VVVGAAVLVEGDQQRRVEMVGAGRRGRVADRVIDPREQVKQAIARTVDELRGVTETRDAERASCRRAGLSREWRPPMAGCVMAAPLRRHTDVMVESRRTPPPDDDRDHLWRMTTSERVVAMYASSDGFVELDEGRSLRLVCCRG
jgi:hypothetical protein